MSEYPRIIKVFTLEILERGKDGTIKRHVPCYYGMLLASSLKEASDHILFSKPQYDPDRGHFAGFPCFENEHDMQEFVNLFNKQARRKYLM